MGALLKTIDRCGAPLALQLFWMHAPLAVTREDDVAPYKVTHIPTGWSIGHPCESLAHAVRFARALRRAFRWETVSRDGYDSIPSEDKRALGVAIFAAHYATSRAGRAA